MADINVVALTGRLTRDAELKYTQGGMAVASFALAVNRAKKAGNEWVEEASFFDCSMFDKRAEKLAQYLKKGGQVTIQGSLRQERWEQDGQKRSKVVIVVNDIIFGQRPKAEGKAQEDAPEPFEDDIPF